MSLAHFIKATLHKHELKAFGLDALFSLSDKRKFYAP